MAKQDVVKDTTKEFFVKRKIVSDSVLMGSSWRN
jgi:hypothetical protein